MRVRAHQLMVALPLTLVSALGIAVAVQSFSLESADLLSIAPADSPAPLDAVRGSVEGVVAPPPPARPIEPAPVLAAPAQAAPAAHGITGFTAPAAGPAAVATAPAPKVKTPAVRAQRPRPAAIPRGAPRNPDCVPADPTIRSLPNPHGTARAVPRERAVSGPAAGTPLLPGSIPARNSAGLPGSGAPVSGLINRPSSSRPGPSTSGPAPSISQPGTSRTQARHTDGGPGRVDGEWVPADPTTSTSPGPSSQDPSSQAPFVDTLPADAEQAGFSDGTPWVDGDPASFSDPATSGLTTSDPADQIGAPGQTPQAASCNGPSRGGPGRPSRRRVPATEPVISRDGGLATPARSGW